MAEGGGEVPGQRWQGQDDAESHEGAGQVLREGLTQGRVGAGFARVYYKVGAWLKKSELETDETAAYTEVCSCCMKLVCTG